MYQYLALLFPLKTIRIYRERFMILVWAQPLDVIRSCSRQYSLLKYKVSFIFQGAIQELKIVTKSHGYLVQCPEQNTSKYCSPAGRGLYYRGPRLLSRLISLEDSVMTLRGPHSRFCARYASEIYFTFTV